MNGKLIVKLGTGMELVGVLILAGIALKRNNECYKAEKELLKVKLDGIFKDVEIYKLRKELEELKNKKQES